MLWVAKLAPVASGGSKLLCLSTCQLYPRPAPLETAAIMPSSNMSAAACAAFLALHRCQPPLQASNKTQHARQRAEASTGRQNYETGTELSRLQGSEHGLV